MGDINKIIENLPMVLLILISCFFVATEFLKAIKTWKEARKKSIDQEVERQRKEFDLQNELNKIHERFDNIDRRFDEVEDRVKSTESRIENLTISDMHDIKAWIVDQYHKFYVGQGWIDAFSAETLDRRYSDYQKEGGNSYIGTLMSQLHSLPMDPEHSIHKKKAEEEEKKEANEEENKD